MGLKYLETLENQVLKILRQAVKHGYTFIITNAGLGWVELTANKFFPRVHRDVIRNADKYGIKIISAREMYESELPGKK